jgi:hypothetical protein
VLIFNQQFCFPTLRSADDDEDDDYDDDDDDDDDDDEGNKTDNSPCSS